MRGRAAFQPIPDVGRMHVLVIVTLRPLLSFCTGQGPLSAPRATWVPCCVAFSIGPLIILLLAPSGLPKVPLSLPHSISSKQVTDSAVAQGKESFQGLDSWKLGSHLWCAYCRHQAKRLDTLLPRTGQEIGHPNHRQLFTWKQETGSCEHRE